MTDLRRGWASPLPAADHGGHFRRFSLEHLGHVLRGPSPLVQRARLAPRLARQAVRRKHHLHRDLFAVYLLELERLVDGERGPRKEVA